MSTGIITTIITISIIIIAAPHFSKFFKLPLTTVEIIFGTITGYFGLIQDSEIFTLISEVGFLYLMFLAGTEVDLRVLKNIDIKIIKNSLIYISLLYFFSFISSYYLNLGNVFIIIMPLISVGLIMSLLKEYGKDQKWLKLAMLVGILGEVISITLITFASAALKFGIGFKFYKTVLILILFLLAIVIIFRIVDILFWWFPNIKIFLMPYRDNDEKDIRISFAIFFILIAITLYLHLEIAFGAFIAGIFITTFFHHKEELTHKLASFGFGFIVPVFFIYIGTTLKIDSLMTPKILKLASLVTIVMIFTRILASLLVFHTLKIKERVLFGFAHSMPLTLLVAVASIAYNSHAINEEIYYSIILASIFEVVISMISIKVIFFQKSSTK